MNYYIYAVGEKIDKSYIEAINEYIKRLNRYCKINFCCLKKNEELDKKLQDKYYKIAILTDKNTISSEKLAEKLMNLGLSGKADIAFIISEDFAGFDETLSISSMKICLGLKSTILLEQIYRAYRINTNQPYHK